MWYHFGLEGKEQVHYFVDMLDSQGIECLLAELYIKLAVLRLVEVWCGCSLLLTRAMILTSRGRFVGDASAVQAAALARGSRLVQTL
jgi:hypothetical protein